MKGPAPQPSWTGIPPGLPQACPSCGRVFGISMNYRTVEHPMAARLNRAASWALVAWPPFAILLFVTGVLPVVGAGVGLGFAIVAVLITPTAVLGLVARWFPQVIRLACVSCGWHRLFRFGER